MLTAPRAPLLSRRAAEEAERKGRAATAQPRAHETDLYTAKVAKDTMGVMANMSAWLTALMRAICRIQCASRCRMLNTSRLKGSSQLSIFIASTPCMHIRTRPGPPSTQPSAARAACGVAPEGR